MRSPASFMAASVRVAASSIEMDSLAAAISDFFQLAGAVFNGATVMTIDRHDAGGNRRAQRCASGCDGSRANALGGVAP